MFALELKRLFKTRLNAVLLLLSLALSALLAYMPVTFCYACYFDDDGNKVVLNGRDALEYTKKRQAEQAGEVTPDKIRTAVLAYQEVFAEYGVNIAYELPSGVSGTRLLHLAPQIHGVTEVYADPDTGIAPGIREVDAENVEHFYADATRHLDALMKLEQGNHPAAGKMAAKLFAKVGAPYEFYPGIDTNSMDYQIILAFLAMLCCTVIAAPIFTSDYQTGADDILRCTRNGRAKLGMVKIAAGLLITGAAFALCMTVYIVLTDSLFGWESTKTSMQMLYSAVNLLNLSVGGLQIFTAAAGFLSLLAAVSLTLFLSAGIKNMTASLSTSLLFALLPMIVYFALSGKIGEWICGILPSAGLGLQTSILYSVTGFCFLNMGRFSLWLPQAMVLAYLVEIPVFLFLAVKVYCRGAS